MDSAQVAGMRTEFGFIIPAAHGPTVEQFNRGQADPNQKKTNNSPGHH
jgi:hypothetical protein